MMAMCDGHAACSVTADMSSTWVDGSIDLNPKQLIGGMCISCHHNLQYKAKSWPIRVACCSSETPLITN